MSPSEALNLGGCLPQRLVGPYVCLQNKLDVSVTLLPKEQKNISWHICLVSPPPTNKTFVRVEQDYVCVGVLTSNNYHVTNTHFAC